MHIIYNSNNIISLLQMEDIKSMFRSYWSLWLLGKARGHIMSNFCKGSADNIIEHIWIGDAYSAQNKKFLDECDIKLIVSCAVGSVASYPYDINYELIELLDVPDEEIGDYLNRVLPVIKRYVDNGQNVLVHCEKGASRSATVVAGYLIKYHNMSTDEAIKFMKTRRGIIEPNSGYKNRLKNFEIEARINDEDE